MCKKSENSSGKNRLIIIMMTLLLTQGTALSTEITPEQSFSEEDLCNTGTQLSSVQKYWLRHPETQWPPSRRKQLENKNCASDKSGTSDKMNVAQPHSPEK